LLSPVSTSRLTPLIKRVLSPVSVTHGGEDGRRNAIFLHKEKYELKSGSGVLRNVGKGKAVMLVRVLLLVEDCKKDAQSLEAEALFRAR